MAWVGVDVVKSLWLLVLLSPRAQADGIPVNSINLERVASSFLEQLSARTSSQCTQVIVSDWNYYTNVTEHNRRAMVTAQLKFGEWEKEAWQMVQGFTETLHLLPDHMRRQLDLLSVLGPAALPQRQLEEYTNLKSEMMSIYSTAKTCDFRNQSKCDLSLDPELKELLRTSQDYDELSHVWRTWRDSSGKKMRNLYRRYVTLSNTAAKLNGFDTMDILWLTEYGDNDTFAQDVNRVHHQLAPLYRQLHAYVRRKLRQVYGPEKVSARGPIPAHLLGDMWAQMWDNIYPILKPYPAKKSIDVTEEMRTQGYTAKDMFEVADDFFVSLGLPRLPPSFWRDSLIEKPKDREVLCHAYAFDFCNGKDFRVKMCTKVTMSDLMTVHHELGHIHYFMQYVHLPHVFRKGANGGFHEALGDLLGMNVATPSYLKKISLLPDLKEDKKVEINFLLKMALNRVAFVPFAYLMDVWRWDVFRSKVPEAEWNCAWWKRRVELQGVKPPVPRTEDDFDPGAKYHVAGGCSYLRYLVSDVLQYQFQQALCKRAGKYHPGDPSRPLHKCNIYNSTSAGHLLKSMMQQGRSVDWKEALRGMTGGSGELDATAMREYFKPLEDWLTNNNAKHKEYVGWEADGEYCSSGLPHPPA